MIHVLVVLETDKTKSFIFFVLHETNLHSST
jgi:hypothetical protein